MPRHHFVPKFLLRRRATNGKFVSYHFEVSVSRVIENPKAIVASACQIENLNTFFGVPTSQRDFPETQFLTPRVDTPAAAALQVMLANGVRALSAKQRIEKSKQFPFTVAHWQQWLRLIAFTLVATISEGGL